MSDAVSHEKIRSAIMKLLSDAEIAKVATAETKPHLHEGAEFIDLEAVEKGVQITQGGGLEHMGHALPRHEVAPATWQAILALLPHPTTA